MFVHVAPFLHGEDSQGFTKRREIPEYGELRGECGEYLGEYDKFLLKKPPFKKTFLAWEFRVSGIEVRDNLNSEVTNITS